MQREKDREAEEKRKEREALLQKASKSASTSVAAQDEEVLELGADGKWMNSPFIWFYVYDFDNFNFRIVWHGSR